MKKFSRVLCVALSLIMVLTVFGSLAGCPNNNNKVTVTFMSGTSTFTTVQVTKGQAVSRPSTSPSAPSGQSFIHWYEGTDESVEYDWTKAVDDNLTLYAFFAQTVDVTILNKDTNEEVAVRTAQVGVLTQKWTDIKPGSNRGIGAWFKEDGVTSFSFPATFNEPTTLKVEIVIQYTISFDLQGGTSPAIADIVLGEGEVLNMPDEEETPTQDGYDFEGWIKGSTKYTLFGNAVTESFTLRAKWKENGTLVIKDAVLVLNTGELDGILNPFFSSSAYDSEIHSQTQIAMLNTDSKGNVDMGPHTPSVALDYTQTTYINTSGTPQANPTQSQIKGLTAEQKKNSNVFYTEYKFLIKNGIKFSDGEPLTIKDVIFNMYVYLDPCYTGSSTMYSTPIKGLNAYRKQNPSLTTEGSSSTDDDAQFRNDAIARRTNIGQYFSSNNTQRSEYRNDVANTAAEDKILSDVQWLRKELWTELNDDWRQAFSIPTNDDKSETEKYGYKSGYEDEEFTEAWEIFLSWYGIISVTYEANGKVKKENGQKMIDYTACDGWYKPESSKISDPAYSYDFMKDCLLKIVYHYTLGVLTDGEKGNWYDDDASRIYTGNQAYLNYPQIDLDIDVDTGAVLGSRLKDVKLAGKGTGAGSERATILADQDYLVSRFLKTKEQGNIVFDNIVKVASSSASGKKAITEWTAQEKSDYLDTLKLSSGERRVPTIQGIQVETTRTFKGQMGTEYGGSGETYVFDDEHYVLKITILGVDPKAIWNFGFAVTPMHYYSNSYNKSGGFTAADDYRSFNYPGIVAGVGGIESGEGYDSSKFVSVGFKNISSSDYFSNIFKDPSVMGVPMGAGTFKATNSSDGENPTPATFVAGGKTVYYYVNTYFNTTGDLLTNAKFLRLRYVVTESTKVLNSLKVGALSMGEVNSKLQNKTDADAESHLTTRTINNNGYGYVGINASKVPDINVRKAIMTVMDTSFIADYYQRMAEIIYRPMSKNSWAYPEDATDKYPYGTDATAARLKAEQLIASSGYTKNAAGILQRTNLKTGATEKLEYTFTIAGSETDHPAYNMFDNASKILNLIGFKTKVYCDSQALIKLASGNLAVWAAAWGASVDPDMYQVYHKDSQASSVTAWGYPYLIKEKNGTDQELAIINSLATKIEEARQTLVQEDRKDKYQEALNLVMDLAIEYPTYQRYNLVVFDHTKIMEASLNRDYSAYSTLLNKIWEVRLLR